MSLQLNKFNMNMIKDDSVVVLIGKRNTGKSYLTKDMLYYKQDLTCWYSYFSYRKC